MKYATAFWVVVLSLVIASAQAADVNMRFFSKAPGEALKEATDVHYVLANDEEKVAEGSLEDTNGFDVSVDNGAYFLTVEQPSTGYFGSVVLSMNDEVSQMVFLLTPDGLQYLEGRHTCDYYDCDCMKNNDGKDCSLNCHENENGYKCTCDENCICHDDVLLGSERPVGVAGNGVPGNGAVSPVEYATPVQYPGMGTAPMSGGYGGGLLGSPLGLAGLAAGIVGLALIDDDDPTPASPWKCPTCGYLWEHKPVNE